MAMQASFQSMTSNCTAVPRSSVRCNLQKQGPKLVLTIAQAVPEPRTLVPLTRLVLEEETNRHEWS